MTSHSSIMNIAIAAGVGALVAGSLVFLLPPRISTAGSLVPASTSLEPEQMNDLDRRLKELEATQIATKTAKSVQRVPVHATDPSAIAALMQRVTRIEARLDQQAQQTQKAAIPTPEVSRSSKNDPAVRAKSIRAHQLRILDPQLTEQAKLEAWSELRSLGEKAWTNNVVLEMSRIGLTSQDAAVRADVWRQADGRSTSVLLVPGLLKALSSDGDAKVREEAAETLENYLSDLTVKNALELAMRSDRDKGVRRQASRSLAGGGR